jgi:hypothetical protein
LQSLFAFVKITFARDGKSDRFRFSGVATRFRRSSPLFVSFLRYSYSPRSSPPETLAASTVATSTDVFIYLLKIILETRNSFAFGAFKKRSREENVDALKRRVSFNDATLIFRAF